MRTGLFYAILFFSLPLYLNSPLGTEMLFLIPLGALFFLPRNSAFFLCIVVAFCVDYFSPIKGVSVVAYLVGMGVALVLSRHLLTTRSFLSFFLLGVLSWTSMEAVKRGIFFIMSLIMPELHGGTILGFYDLGTGAYTLLAVLCSFALMYPLLCSLRASSDERRALHH